MTVILHVGSPSAKILRPGIPSVCSCTRNRGWTEPAEVRLNERPICKGLKERPSGRTLSRSAKCDLTQTHPGTFGQIEVCDP